MAIARTTALEIVIDRLQKKIADLERRLQEVEATPRRITYGGGLRSHGNQFHSPDLLAVDGSNEMQGDIDFGTDLVQRQILFPNVVLRAQVAPYSHILKVVDRSGLLSRTVQSYCFDAAYLRASLEILLSAGADLKWKTSDPDPYRALIKWDETLWGWQLIDTDSGLLDLELYKVWATAVATMGMMSRSDGCITISGSGTAPKINFQTDAAPPIKMQIMNDGGVFMYNLKSGANQGAAGAAADELWVDTADNSIKIGV